jgi:cob(I)alamin adenosyltransferase
MIHIYTGDGKGKTTAALGLALRAAGRGKKVVIVQFMKGSDTGELHSLAQLGIPVLRNRRDYGFFSQISEPEREKIISENNENLNEALNLNPPWELLILDEALIAYTWGALNRGIIDELVQHEAHNPERDLVLTGRNADPGLLASADYVSELRKIKHPYDSGIKAREGIEY